MNITMKEVYLKNKILNNLKSPVLLANTPFALYCTTLFSVDRITSCRETGCANMLRKIYIIL